MTKKIELTQGKFAIVDDEDYEYINQWKWHFINVRHSGNGYACRSFIKNKKYIRIYMHRVVTNCIDGMDVDHINGDKSDNRKINLRVCTRSSNLINKGSLKTKRRSSSFKGVHFCNKRNKYIASIRIKGKAVFQKSFDNEIDAAIAYNNEVYKYHGEFSFKNEV